VLFSYCLAIFPCIHLTDRALSCGRLAAGARRWTKSDPRQEHNTPLSLKAITAASFKRWFRFMGRAPASSGACWQRRLRTNAQLERSPSLLPGMYSVGQMNLKSWRLAAALQLGFVLPQHPTRVADQKTSPNSTPRPLRDARTDCRSARIAASSPDRGRSFTFRALVHDTRTRFHAHKMAHHDD